jgi:hypothetical protein
MKNTYTKTGDDLNYLTKFVEQCFQKHISMHQKVQKALFCDVTKVENFERKCLTLSKKIQKSSFKHFRFGRSSDERVKYFFCLLF